MENANYFYKDTFAVIGKAGRGSADNPQAWILPLWDEANANFTEIVSVVRKNENGMPLSVWGAMNDVDEGNKRWGENAPGEQAQGKYMAGCEADIDAQAPTGWTKWIIPAQTYMTVKCTMDEYGIVFSKIVNDPKIQIVGTVHERYPEPGNPSIVELWFPIADGMMFCQSCYMPMTKPEKFGTEANGNPSLDYCCYCYANGDFTTKQTLEEAVEGNIQFWRKEGDKTDDEARARIWEVFPKLKRWAISAEGTK